MKLFSLKREPAIGIIALAVLALLGGTIGMWAFQHNAEFQELHERLSRDAAEMVRQLRVFNSKSDQSQLPTDCIPLDLQERLLEVRSDQGALLYHSPRLVDVLTPHQATGFYRDIDGLRHRLESFQSGNLMLLINADLDSDDNFIHEIGGGLLLAIPAMFVIILVGGLWLKDRALRPVQSIRDDVCRVTAQSLGRPLPTPPAPEEVTELVSALNVTFKSLSSSFEQAARFSADAAHQLRTPLTLLRLSLEESLTDPHMSDRQRSRVDDLLNQAHRLTSIVEKLLLLSRADAGRLDLQPTNLDPNELFFSLLDDITVLTEEKGITLESSIVAPRPILADPHSVAMILENLMENAIKYNLPGGRIKLLLSQTAYWTEITIGNTSEAIPADRTAHIFERFFRGAGGAEAPGSGLGLSIARELAEANHGTLELIASAAGWTEFRLSLPSGTTPSQLCDELASSVER